MEKKKKRKGFVYHINYLGIPYNICASSPRQAKLFVGFKIIEEAKRQGFKVTKSKNIENIKNIMRKSKVVKTTERCWY